MTDNTTAYYILDATTKEILHTSYTTLVLEDKEQLKCLLLNTFWTPISLVHKYQLNPDSLIIIPISEYVAPKRTRAKKVQTNK